MRSTRTHYRDSQTTGLYSFSLAACLAEKQQISILQSCLAWFGARTHDRSDELEASTLIITPPIELIYEELWIMNVNVYTTKSCAYGM
jgi:hypothetical protein